jgi:PPOX class F420-dependent enzyme/OxyR family protein/uncharacterized protein (TIGR02246 family)
MALDQASQQYLSGQSRGRLATVGLDGTPQNKPVGFTYNAELGTIDIAGFNMDTSAKYRNVGINPNVAFVVDDSVSEGAAGMRFVEVRGRAERVSVEPPPPVGLSPHIIRIHPRRVISMNIDPGRPGFQTLDVGTVPDVSEAIRPSFGSDDGGTQQANQAVADFVTELQKGWDQQDADVSNRHFANDILWGSPFGVTLQGYEQLHAIHVRLKQQARGGVSSRYEIVQVLAVAPNVAIAHVRRVALDDDGWPVEPTADVTGPFSEMALYVLVRRDQTWWLAAGQNTPVRPQPTSRRRTPAGTITGSRRAPQYRTVSGPSDYIYW